MKNKRRKKVLHKQEVKKAQRSKPLNKLQISKKNNIMPETITVEELKENIANIFEGISAQNGFRKTFVESVVRKLVTDTVQADAVVDELNAGFDSADSKFDVVAKAESEEIDLPPPADNEELVKNLFQ